MILVLGDDTVKCLLVIQNVSSFDSRAPLVLGGVLLGPEVPQLPNDGLLAMYIEVKEFKVTRNYSANHTQYCVAWNECGSTVPIKTNSSEI